MRVVLPDEAGLGQREVSAALLSELESYPGARDNQNYPALLTDCGVPG